MKVVLAGGTGYLGKLLQDHYLFLGHEVVVLSRSLRNESTQVRFKKWNGKTIDKSWLTELKDADVLINLAGRTVDCRYTTKNKKEILDSRVLSTRVLNEAVSLLESRGDLNLKVWVNFASATIYRHSLDKDMNEASGELGSGFSVEVCKAWEQEFYAEKQQVRKIALRLAMVMGKDDGPLVPLLALAKVGLGGAHSSGDQYVSWLSEQDFCGILDFVVQDKNLSGSINACSPFPEKNSVFMSHIRSALGRNFGFRLRDWMLEVGALFLQTETELVKKSRRVVPSSLLKAGYAFKYPKFESYAKDLVGLSSK